MIVTDWLGVNVWFDSLLTLRLLPVTDTEEIVTSELPVLVMTRCCDAEVPTGTFPKDTVCEPGVSSPGAVFPLVAPPEEPLVALGEPAKPHPPVLTIPAKMIKVVKIRRAREAAAPFGRAWARA